MVERVMVIAKTDVEAAMTEETVTMASVDLVSKATIKVI